VAGEPFWGLALAVLSVGCCPPDAVRGTESEAMSVLFPPIG